MFSDWFGFFVCLFFVVVFCFLGGFCLFVYFGVFLVGWGLGVFCLFFGGIVSFGWGLVFLCFGFLFSFGFRCFLRGGLYVWGFLLICLVFVLDFFSLFCSSEIFQLVCSHLIIAKIRSLNFKTSQLLGSQFQNCIIRAACAEDSTSPNCVDLKLLYKIVWILIHFRFSD